MVATVTVTGTDDAATRGATIETTVVRLSQTVGSSSPLVTLEIDKVIQTSKNHIGQAWGGFLLYMFPFMIRCSLD